MTFQHDIILMDEIEILCYDVLMQQARKTRHHQAIRPMAIERSSRIMFAATMFSLVVLTILLGFKLFRPEEKRVIAIPPPALPTARPGVNVAIGPDHEGVSSFSGKDGQQAVVGIVAGHKGYDPGAVCDDGLTEAEINYTIALNVTQLLKRQGIQANLLDEYDDRLSYYQADALVSVHADSCNIPGATGFKVARVTNSAIPEAEDRLVSCLYQEYGTYTGLSPHPASITDNMTNYHAFNEIAPTTPGAIIETGFMLEDRYLLEHKPKVVARGIAAGILCFLNNKP